MTTAVPVTGGRSGHLGASFVVLICLATLGTLCGGAVFAILASAMCVLWLLLLAVLLVSFNGQARREHGARAVAGAVASGFALLAPFTALAAVSQLWFHWHSAQAFAAAGLMAAGAATGGEVVRLGGGRIVGSLLPMLWSVLLSLAWMLLSGFVATAIN